MDTKLYKVYRVIYEILPTFFNCFRSGLPFDSSWNIQGRPRIITRAWYDRLLRGMKGGTITIGNKFSCFNSVTSNSIGLIQPCVFDVLENGSFIKIGNNVGISGSTLNATIGITIEDNVNIGSGCIITDTDSHPIEYAERIANNKHATKAAPIIIKEGAFIGARSIVMKGVTIGTHSVIGAGSVVTKSIPDNCIACGNPAKVTRYFNTTE